MRRCPHCRKRFLTARRRDNHEWQCPMRLVLALDWVMSMNRKGYL